MREYKFRFWHKNHKQFVEGDYMFGRDGFQAKAFIEAQQYVGLEDTERKEIYEGDILYNSHVSRERPGLVEFSNIHHAYRIVYPRRKTDSRDEWDMLHGTEHCFKIIGNIKENPELLK